MDQIDNFPDFLQEINSLKELLNAQTALFAQGYTWGGDRAYETGLWYPEINLTYPIYISNKPAYKFEGFRTISRKFFYYDDDINVFDTKLVRKFKLKVLDKSGR